MTRTFPDLVIGGVLIAPFVSFAVAAGVLLALLRPLLGVVGFERAFSNPPLAQLGIYVVILAVLIVPF